MMKSGRVLRMMKSGRVQREQEGTRGWGRLRSEVEAAAREPLRAVLAPVQPRYRLRVTAAHAPALPRALRRARARAQQRRHVVHLRGPEGARFRLPGFASSVIAPSYEDIHHIYISLW